MKFLIVLLVAAAANALAPLYTHQNAIRESYLITLKKTPGCAVKPIAANLRGLNSLKINREYEALGGFAATLKPKALELIRKNECVDFVEEDEEIQVDSTVEWGLDRIDQETLPLDNIYTPQGSGSRSVSVYVLDTGLNYEHEDFEDRAPREPSYPNNNGFDCNGHGTNMAGVVGGKKYGVAKNVLLYSVRVVGCNGIGSGSDVLRGMDYVLQRTGKRIVSMSLGTSFSNALNNAVASLYNANVPVIASAGNENKDACNKSPASSPLAFTVGAIDQTDKIADFSNWGNCVNIFAPGVQIRTASHESSSGVATTTGTSPACAFVAGAAALLCSKMNGNNCTPADIYKNLREQATVGEIEGLTGDKSSSPNRLLYVG